LLICGLNVANFTFRLPELFSANPYTSDLLKFDQANAAY